MRLLHTSDWHLGQNFMSRDRKEEHQKFLSWLLETIEEQAIDVLIIAGDIFDTGTPPNYAEEMYFRFLADVSRTCCCSVVVTGGNHDSVSALNAPRRVLKAINTDVIACRSENAADDIVVIKNNDDEPIGLICAVPFLRERDIRSPKAGESYEEKNKAILDGIKDHYVSIAKEAESLNKTFDAEVPIIATGHLYASGCALSDSVRDIYVGNCEQVSAGVFGSLFDYVALGHLHRAQTVGANEIIRYSGSPIPLSFSEASAQKYVVCIDFSESLKPAITEIEIPEFRRLRCVKGDCDQINFGIETLDCSDEHPVWLEVLYDSDEWISDLETHVQQWISEKPIELFAVKNVSRNKKRQLEQQTCEYLDELSVDDVFERKLDAEDVEDEDRKELRLAFSEIMSVVHTAQEDR